MPARKRRCSGKGLGAAELFQFVAGGETSPQEGQGFVLGKRSHMGRADFVLGRLSPGQHQKPVVQRADIRHPEQEATADLKRAGNFVKYPEDLLGMLQQLVGNDQIGLTVS